MNEKMRRKDRETTEEKAYEILKNGEYGILSTIGEDGYPYGVPLNFAVEGNKIYFHCAPNSGLKLKNVEYSNKVSFCTVQNNRIDGAKLTSKYESAVAIVPNTTALSYFEVSFARFKTTELTVQS